MFSDALPGGEPIIIERVKPEIYCGGCMKKMKLIQEGLFRCPICRMDYKK